MRHRSSEVAQMGGVFLLVLLILFGASYGLVRLFARLGNNGAGEAK